MLELNGASSDTSQAQALGDINDPSQILSLTLSGTHTIAWISPVEQIWAALALGWPTFSAL